MKENWTHVNLESISPEAKKSLAIFDKNLQILSACTQDQEVQMLAADLFFLINAQAIPLCVNTSKTPFNISTRFQNFNLNSQITPAIEIGNSILYLPDWKQHVSQLAYVGSCARDAVLAMYADQFKVGFETLTSGALLDNAMRIQNTVRQSLENTRYEDLSENFSTFECSTLLKQINDKLITHDMIAEVIPDVPALPRISEHGIVYVYPPPKSEKNQE